MPVCPVCDVPNPPDEARCTSCGTPLPQPSSEAETQAGTVVSSPSSGWSRPGTRQREHLFNKDSVLGNRYEILEVLGEGGMGAVYKARDREVDRVVALKVIHPELTTSREILERFKKELVLARQITHPNIVRIYDLGVAGATKFITMEFIEGQDLGKALKERRRLAPRPAAVIMLEIARALEAAHSQAVVHRDLKPQNIMLGAGG